MPFSQTDLTLYKHDENKIYPKVGSFFVQLKITPKRQRDLLVKLNQVSVLFSSSELKINVVTTQFYFLETLLKLCWEKKTVLITSYILITSTND